jgi:hypothetical protein
MINGRDKCRSKGWVQAKKNIKLTECIAPMPG